MSCDDTLREAASRGLLLNNFFQLANGTWQANFRDDRGGHPFGEAKDPATALGAALAAVPDRPSSGVFD